MTQIVKTDTISLKTVSKSDTSRYIMGFTKDYGKITLVAKGIRKPTSRFGACLEPFTLSEVVFYHKEQREFYYVSHCDIVNAFPALHQSLEKIRYAAATSALIVHGIPFEETNVSLFNLIFSMLTEIDRSDEEMLPILYLAFQTKFLTLLGFKPNVERCGRCQTEYELPPMAHFAVSQGGLLCPSCGAQIASVEMIDREVVQALRHFLTEKFYRNKRLQLRPQAMHQLANILKQFFEFHLEKPLNVIPQTFF